MSSITTEATIVNLKASFSTHGLPDVLVTDNGPSFKSEGFRQFVSLNGIQHLTSAPYHPASNGLAERAVQTFKNAMKKLSGGSVQDRLTVSYSATVLRRSLRLDTHQQNCCSTGVLSVFWICHAPT